MEGEGGQHVGDYKAFLGGLSWETTEDGLMMYFKSIVPDPSKVIHASINRDRFTGQPRGFGFVSFADGDTLAQVCQVSKHQIDGKDVEVKTAIRKDRPDAEGEDVANSGGGGNTTAVKKGSVSGTTAADFQNPEKKLFVGGLLCETTEDDLVNYFSRFGTVTSVVIKYDPDTRRSRGFGFVTFDDVDAIDKAWNQGRHHVLLGKRVEIKRYQKTATGTTAGDAETTEKTVKPALRYKERRIEDVYREYFRENPPPGMRY